MQRKIRVQDGETSTRLYVGRKQGVDYRDEVRHNEKNDQLFVKTTMKVGGRE